MFLVVQELRFVSGGLGKGGGVDVRKFAIFCNLSQFFCLAPITCPLVTVVVNAKPYWYTQFCRNNETPFLPMLEDDNIRRLRFMLQFHGDIEAPLL